MAKNLRLKAARAEHDMTQGDLAEAVGATRQTIGLIEAGKYNPSLALCIAICKTLDRTMIVLTKHNGIRTTHFLQCHSNFP